MRSSAKLKISTEDLESERENPFSLWTAGPSSPPFNHAQSIHKSNDSLASSPSTPSELEFEFDRIASLEIKDDPPVSPKLISSFATGYWGAAVSSFNAGASVMDQEITGTPVIKDKITPLSHPISSTKQPPAPPSPSVRQLMAEERHGEHDNDFSLDFYSAPQTPLPTPPRTSATASKQRQDEPSSLNIVTRVGRRKSNSAVLDRHADDELVLLATQKNQVLQSSKSESNSHYALWTSAFGWEKSEEEKSSGVKKQGSKSCVKWAFKDLLRRTVPSSKADSHYITKTMGASSSTKSLPSSKSNPNISPLASPMHSSTSMSTPWSTRPSTPGRSPTSTPGRSPPCRPLTPGRTPTHQTLNRTPTPSPPRSPLSPHAVHYQQNKAQSLELNRKTFLPYRQSLLGCLGGPGAFSPDQQVW